VARFEQYGGTLTLGQAEFGTLSLGSGLHTWSGGTWTGGGRTELGANGTLAVSGSTEIAGWELALTGTLSRVEIGSGGTLTWLAAGKGFNGVVSAAASATLHNLGTIQVASGNLVLDAMDTQVLNITSPGAVEVLAGSTLSLGNTPPSGGTISASMTGTVTVASDATFANHGATLTLQPSGGTLGGNWVQTGSVTNLQLGAQTPVFDSITIDGGSLSMAGAASTNAFTQNAGTFSGAGTLTLNGGTLAFTHAWSGGTWAGSGTVELQGLLNISQPNVINTLLDQTLRIKSGAMATLTGWVDHPSGTAAVNVDSGGTLRLQLPSSPDNVVFASTGNGTLSLNNQGLMQVWGDTGTASIGVAYLKSTERLRSCCSTAAARCRWARTTGQPLSSCSRASQARPRATSQAPWPSHRPLGCK
jgi:hypothetical protein